MADTTIPTDAEGDGPTLDTRPTGAERTITVGDGALIERACNAFEDAWRAGGEPRVEDYLVGAAGQVRGILVRELVCLDLEYRRDRGERPDPEDYRALAPGADRPIAEAFDAAAPEVVGEYELVGKIGEGGMGEVYRARQRAANRLVALKLMRPGVGERRFLLEVEAVANLDHPNIITIFGAGRWQGRYFASMKLVEGGDLRAVAGPLRDDPRGSAALMARVARAVHHAHTQGIIHRDLKPANVLLAGSPETPPASREPIVTDFGLVKRLDAAVGESPTGSGAMVGTPEYMAPEQASAEAVDERTDVYGLGATLYALVTGRPPFRARGRDRMELLVEVREREPDPPRRQNPKVPAALELICLRCLEKQPGRRYATAVEVAEDLERFLRDEPVEARIGPVGRLRRWVRREPALAFRLLGLGSVTLLTQLNYVTYTHETRRPWLHAEVTLVELFWIAAAVGLQAIGRRSGRGDRLGACWIVVDVAAVTLLLHLLEATDSVLVVGYPLLVAASGLWSRERLAWLTAGLSAVAYAALWVASYLRHGMIEDYYLNIVVACLLVTGLVVAHQVRRFRALSRYYEQRSRPS